MQQLVWVWKVLGVGNGNLIWHYNGGGGPEGTAETVHAMISILTKCLVLYTVSDRQPVETYKNFCDVFISSGASQEARSSILNLLKHVGMLVDARGR